MKITIRHFFLVAVATALTGCETPTTAPPPNTHNDGSMKVRSGPYNSMGSADPQGPREPR
ncbi:hypothetical protein CfE428DRAFT_2736 [Chthoniobacter flavus Ellin428]|uniref:Lipoprotein n=1 Tax=Chthoniobacter flavus Ellin428 TaxID=497964 RepID=B4D1E8_9BACT|nr:hypothetical protein CfE428DRAFT_2736 [Chthoniobacter flavus Ellin428]TCO92804.1 hypothetical protein EV701_10581 [Chthoniobacter flavus]